eukprot:351140-Chlamydomonas_euryale.AAC.18
MGIATGGGVAATSALVTGTPTGACWSSDVASCDALSPDGDRAPLDRLTGGGAMPTMAQLAGGSK